MDVNTVTQFVDHLQKRARYTFTREEAEAMLDLKRPALTKGLQRLQNSGRIVRIRRGFYVIVPVEYQAAGIIPPDWYVDDLMRYLGCTYYVGVLSAAALHGAAHQQPQEYHIVTPRMLRAVRLKGVHLRFFRKSCARETPTSMVKGYTGLFPASTAAATALDCVRYAHAIGGLDTVLTVLNELVAGITPEDLLHAALRESDLSIVQRTGWLFEQTKRPEITEDLAAWVTDQHPSKTRLDLRTSAAGSPRDVRWQVIVNAHPESEA
jgi:predicted transcriptional regulator of viral defense system